MLILPESAGLFLKYDDQHATNKTPERHGSPGDGESEPLGLYRGQRDGEIDGTESRPREDRAKGLLFPEAADQVSGDLACQDDGLGEAFAKGSKSEGNDHAAFPVPYAFAVEGKVAVDESGVVLKPGGEGVGVGVGADFVDEVVEGVEAGHFESTAFFITEFQAGYSARS